MSNIKKHDSGASEGARRATEDASESSARAGAGRWSARRKVSVVLELLRGTDLESTIAGVPVNLPTRDGGRRRGAAPLEVGSGQR